MQLAHSFALLTLTTAPILTSASDNGLALTPPMGWRSWNLFGANVDQKLIESIMDGMLDRSRTVNGVPTSLLDLGYNDVGLDDNWQLCGTYGDNDQLNYHLEDGTPVVNLQVFPDMKGMVDHAHNLGLKAGFYGNNCICNDKTTSDHKFYEGDVKKFREFGFDSWKLDGCGAQLDMQLWEDLLNASGGPVVVENCHWGSAEATPFEPTLDWCPWSFFRTSGDIRASFPSMLSNLNTTRKYADSKLSRPGCWAYPDMLEVGCKQGPGGDEDRGLTFEEARSHFGAWCVVSSPLTLSHDVLNSTIADEIWPIISNREAIAINQAWAGHSGTVFEESSKTVTLVDGTEWVSHQFLYKPLGLNVAAVLLMNIGAETKDLVFKISNVPSLKEVKRGSCKVRDVWEQVDLGEVTGDSFSAKSVKGHDSAFLVVDCN